MLKRFFSRLHWMVSPKRPTITKGLLLALAMSVATLFYLSVWVSNSHYHSATRSTPELRVKCRLDNNDKSSGSINDHRTSASLKIDNKVLVLVETQFSKRGQDIIAILESNRMKYKMELAGKSLPYLTHSDKGKFGVVVFESFESYLLLDKWNRQLLDKYCRDYSVGIVAFTQGTRQSYVNAQVSGFPLYVHTNLALREYSLNAQSDVLRISRPGEVVSGELPGEDWTVFVSNHSTYKPVAYASMRHRDPHPEEYTPASSDGSAIRYVTVIQDRGMFDDIHRVIFGSGFQFWLHRVLFMDALSYLSHGKFSVPLERYVLVDIDDIFVGKEGIRMTPHDVQVSSFTIQQDTRLVEDLNVVLRKYIFVLEILKQML